MVAVFLVGGGPDAADAAVGQHRLEDVGRIHGAAAGGARAHDGVDFVDEQDGPRHLAEVGDDALQALFKVAPVLGARQQRAHVQGEDAHVAKFLGHFAARHAQCQPFGDGGLAHAGVAHVQRVVLAPPGQHLDGPFQLLRPTDQRVDAAVAGAGGEVHREFFQRVGARGIGRAVLAVGVTGAAALAVLRHAVRDVLQHVQPAHPLRFQEIGGVGVVLFEDGGQHVADFHGGLARRLHVANGPLQHALHAQRLHHFGGGVGGQRLQMGGEKGFQAQAQGLHVHPDGFEDGLARLLAGDGVEQVLQRQELVVARPHVVDGGGERCFKASSDHVIPLRGCSAVDSLRAGRGHARGRPWSRPPPPCTRRIRRRPSRGRPA